MQRREFITILGGTAITWPLAVRAQQPERMRRIGVLQYINKSDPELQRRISVFVQGLQKLGWREGTNLVIDYRYGAERFRTHSARRSRTRGPEPRRDLDQWRSGFADAKAGDP